VPDRRSGVENIVAISREKGLCMRPVFSTRMKEIRIATTCEDGMEMRPLNIEYDYGAKRFFVYAMARNAEIICILHLGTDAVALPGQLTCGKQAESKTVVKPETQEFENVTSLVKTGVKPRKRQLIGAVRSRLGRVLQPNAARARDAASMPPDRSQAKKTIALIPRGQGVVYPVERPC